MKGSRASKLEQIYLHNCTAHLASRISVNARTNVVMDYLKNYRCFNLFLANVYVRFQFTSIHVRHVYHHSIIKYRIFNTARYKNIENSR